MNEVKTGLLLSNEQIEKFLKVYPQIIELAKNFQRSPEDLIKFFVKIGEIAMSKSGEYIIDEIHNDLKTFLSSKDVDKVLLSVQRVSNLLDAVKKLRDDFIK